ncbi:hypothetical protein Tco_0531769 [Tanacetum coccineum]
MNQQCISLFGHYYNHSYPVRSPFSQSNDQVSVKFKTRLGYNAASSTATSPAVESFVNSCKMLENQEYNKSKSDKGYHAVPPPYTGNFVPYKPDLTFIDEIVESENIDVTTIVTPSNVKTVESNHEFANVKNNYDAVEPKTVWKNSFRPLVIEDWNSDDDSEVEIIPNVKDKTVRPSTEKIKFVKSTRETVEKNNLLRACLSRLRSDIVSNILTSLLAIPDDVVRISDVVSAVLDQFSEPLRVEVQSCPISSQIEPKSRVFPPNSI